MDSAPIPLATATASETAGGALGSLEQDTDNFGKTAIRLGFLTVEQVTAAALEQARAARNGIRRRLGEVLVEKNLLTAEQIMLILEGQHIEHRRIADYELISKLGEGGMGAVYKARQLSMDRMVALKVLSPRNASNADYRERFEREARAIARLNHPNIVMGIDAGHADGVYYFAMEYVNGETLGQYLRRRGGKLTEKEALTFICQIARALKHAHEHNLLHRDVKPDNILIDRQRGEAKLADLGLARDREATATGGATAAGAAIGTPFYMSPEQARGKALTAATDFYALGGTLFHVLTGQIPFTGATAAVIMARHITDAVPNPRFIEPGISAATSALIVKCLQKDPRQRYQNADELLRDLERALKGEASGAPAAPLPKDKSAARDAFPAARYSDGVAPEPKAIKPARKNRFRRRRGENSSISPLILIVVGIAAVFLLYLVLKSNKTNKTPPIRPAVQQSR